MAELLQLCNEQGEMITDRALPREEVLEKGILHGASHVWIWRRTEEGIEVGVQKRSSHMQSWPGRYDISAAGHIKFGSNPAETAIREVGEELDLEVSEEQLSFLLTYRTEVQVLSRPEWTENEIQWIYFLELPAGETIRFTDKEVDSFSWKTIDAFQQEVLAPEISESWVPHDPEYFEHIIRSLKHLS